jgi:hypothetical protein
MASLRSALVCLLVAAAGCPGAPAAPRASVRLVSPGPRRDEVVACVASITGYRPEVARRLVDRAPVTLPGLTPAAAREGHAALAALGADALVILAPE